MSDTVTITLDLSDDEKKALRHEFSEPYGHEIRIGIFEKLRNALHQAPSGEECAECGQTNCPWHMPDIDALERAAADIPAFENVGIREWSELLLSMPGHEIRRSQPSGEEGEGEGSGPKYPPAERLVESLRWALEFIDDPKRRRLPQFDPDEAPSGDDHDWTEWASAHDWLKDAELAAHPHDQEAPDPDPHHGKLTGNRCEGCEKEQRVGDEGWESRDMLDWCPDCFREDLLDAEHLDRDQEAPQVSSLELFREAIYQELTGKCGLPDVELICALDRAGEEFRREAALVDRPQVSSGDGELAYDDDEKYGTHGADPTPKALPVEPSPDIRTGVTPKAGGQE